MKKGSLFLVIFILFLSSCELEKKKPEDLIAKNEMVLILKDMVLLEATYNTRLIRFDDKNERMTNYSIEILNKFGVSKEKFDSSFEYYSSDSYEFESMLELVFEELNKLETEASKYNEMQVKSDSTLISE